MPDSYTDPRDAAFMEILDAEVSAAMAHTSSAWLGPIDDRYVVALTVSGTGKHRVAVATFTSPEGAVRVVDLTGSSRREFVAEVAS